MHVDRAPRLVVEHGHVKPFRCTGVRHPHARAAGGCANRDAVARGQPVAASKERRGEVEHLVEVAALDQAVALEHGVIGRLRTGERCGVRGDGA